jgi:two-component system sensor histidine kinase KdpD
VGELSGSATYAAPEQELRALRTAFEAAQAEISELRERVRNDCEERDELLTVVSHELRTPVTVIAGYNKLLLSCQVGRLNAEQRRFLEESTKSCQRLSSFIGNLIEASSEVRGEAPLKLHEAPLEPVIVGVLEYLRPLLDESGLRVELQLDPSATLAHFDPSHIEQVLTNLVTNAIKYAQSEAPVTIETSTLESGCEKAVEVAVLDRGPGIPSKDRQRIFEPYVRLTRAIAPGGLGLGLSICRRIVEAHGGTIEVEDRDGGGSRFAFRLPAHGREERGR